ncbi:pre-mRNA-splicing factor CWC25 homolog [Nothobranchius furzeri]|uniref:CWC25 spliceosome-associated protein homolog n=1 Tax=Nothobranchius furzeri TaxID=105023 RepID=A0A1A8V7S2_NOTFU|nr:pre-mRNA-splicing factor CWC25 homolog [Nothobranchius furzeri]KAF7225343.1 CWC25 spliceosome-associated protein-like protein [Nothobranchius furzeri]
MGGGDLNLKKSWHPQTMKNIERVWKAEQKYEAERKKIEELQKELKNERAREEMTRYAEETGAIKKKDDRLDWMYQGPAGQVSRDEYLLGRPIDKQITDQYEEPESGPSAETGLLPGSIFNPTTPASDLDMAAKIREDPLFNIWKREEEKKREILTNPVKMKKIKEMLRQNLEKKDKKKKKKKEKKGDKDRRKEKKHKRRSSSSSSDEDDNHGSHSRDKSADTKSRTHHPQRYGLQPSGSRHHSASATSGHPGRRERSRSRSPHRDHRGGHSSSSSYRTEKKAEPQASSPRRYQKQRNHVSKKLSTEEMEKKRREMMNQAKQREEDRENNVRRYKKQDEQEKQREQNAKLDRHAGFIHDMKLESAASSSLEDRVKRNIHSIQRTPASLDNFMKRN